jgi:hypothetical protein
VTGLRFNLPVGVLLAGILLRFIPMKAFLLGLCFMGQIAHGRLGETREQAEARYGLAKSETTPEFMRPLLEGARELTFEYEGFRIRCALLKATDGREYVVREEYARYGGSPVIPDSEFEAILATEENGQPWIPRATISDSGNSVEGALQKQLKGALAGKSLMRADGAIASRGIGGFPVRLELPHAVKYEAEMKAIKERQTSKAVPKP